MDIPIQVTRSSMPTLNEYIEEIKDLWESRLLTNQGAKHNQLEVELADYLVVSNVALFTNGHLALEYILEVFQLKGEVITTPFTFASTTHAIVRSGLTPVFADINPNDYTMQTDNLESLITEKTSAIMPVHVYGNICNVKEIERIAQKYNLKVIYDAAHAFGVTVNGESIANFGDASMFSFHATKVFNTIEGGALTFKDSNLKNVIEAYKNFGITGPETVEYIGGNSKMNEFQAAMGLCNLRNVEREIEKRRLVYERYLENLSDVVGIVLPRIAKGVISNYSYFPVLFDSEKISRDEIHHDLMKHNIYTRKYFYPLTNQLECYQSKFAPNYTPIAQLISEKILTLPLYADLHLDDVDRICKIIKTKLVLNQLNIY
ncbi:DegT/DnrJ/EryC1/StrS family aminotransferase [Solibacillus sp. MA9]|uniref:DegT/DnrJ/EryC1/StrS family aminotransferase n=1 Tax=Solibacillus palustris TaxID=2908203 RepID=A0ABS9U9L9_9BACL|nr:DegT/DnrJ/EryC1/StrS family aminotransferase [Solibacillus sp. MA9]MCH7321031.1 DegT/DnrJ/EryC1/StrS family aminotransferase [Solibacillus sp. MA9]